MQTFNFFDIHIAVTNQEHAHLQLLSYPLGSPSYISFPDAYVVALSRENEFLKNILNNAYMAMPDGKPSGMMGRRKGFKDMNSVSGFWLCKDMLKSNLTHYFLGSTPERLKKLKVELSKEFPQAKILGFSSPRFVTEEEALSGPVLKEEFKNINVLKPDLIWVGISSPKQDYIIHHHLPLLQHGLMLGVGGVFDYLSGEVNKSPEFVKKLGLRWAWRLAKEPGRMWGKYYYVFKKLSIPYIMEYIKK